MGRKVLVTGGTGFVGGHLLDRLLSEGYQARALVRRTSDVTYLKKLSVELVEGDITDSVSVDKAMADCEMVFHCAAYVADWGPREVFIRTDVEGTRNICRSGLAHGIKRLIHISSVDVMDPYKPHSQSDETAPYPARFRDPYTEGKVRSEKLVLQFAAENGLPAVIIRPAWIWGPRDRATLPRQIDALRSSTFAWPNGGNNVLGLIHVADVVEALLRAARIPKAKGQVYNISDGTKTTSRQYLTRLAEELGMAVPKISIPFSAAYGLAAVMETWAGLTRSVKPPDLTRYGLTYFIHHDWNIEKAGRELGFIPKVKIEAGMAEMIDWYKNEFKKKGNG